MTAKKNVWIVQQGVWATPTESLPLAAACMKAYALGDNRIASEMNIDVFSFDGGLTLAGLANWLLSSQRPPDVIAFSVLGWNYRTFGSLADTFKLVNPAGWVIFGGTHVSYQAERVFAMFPSVDVVVNGEGELTFRELLLTYLDGRNKSTGVGDILGISYRDSDNNTVQTPDRPRIEHLDIIPSPFLTGAIPLTDEHGDFRYDVALMETNRGCPYRCSFCYWGGAIGQRVRSFSRERLRQELEVFGQHKVHTIVLCDANFGMLPSDLEFVEDFIEVREKYGFPRALETSWAKNKSATFYEIVSLMRKERLHTTFTLALQTLDDVTLRHMNRRNMKVNEWEDLAEWLYRQNLECYAQLIWGAPGETVESFLAGYDRLSRFTTRIACYPLMLLPNTDYVTQRERFNMITVRGDNDDFEYVLSHDSMSIADNQLMRRFIFWSRLLVESSVLRHTWTALRVLSDLSLSQAVMTLMKWFSSSCEPSAAPLRQSMERFLIDQEAVGAATRYLLVESAGKMVLSQAWREAIRPMLDKAVVDILDEVLRYDILTFPITGIGEREAQDTLSEVTWADQRYYVRRGVCLKYDVPEVAKALKRGDQFDHLLTDTTLNIYYLHGADKLGPTSYGEIYLYHGMTEQEVTGQTVSR